MTDRELMQQALEALEWLTDETKPAPSKSFKKTATALRERLAQPEPDWDWRHPKAQSLIGAKARLEIKLRLIEQLVEDPNFETTASDMEYWEPLHDKLQERLAQPEQEPVAWRDHVEQRLLTWRQSFVNRSGDQLALDDFMDKQSLDDLVNFVCDEYTTPPQRKPPQFPTMLRKMWSGAEVQKWINENWEQA